MPHLSLFLFSSLFLFTFPHSPNDGDNPQWQGKPQPLSPIPNGKGNHNRYRHRKGEGGSSDVKWGSRGASTAFSFILSASFLCSFICFIFTSSRSTRTCKSAGDRFNTPPPALTPTPLSTGLPQFAPLCTFAPTMECFHPGPSPLAPAFNPTLAPHTAPKQRSRRTLGPYP
jgi:hypothetical protein